MARHGVGVAAAAALAAVMMASAPAASAMGRPEWAEPYLTLPRPAGGYIAANDAWVIVYGEVEYSLRAPRSVAQRYRLLLENVASGPETLTMSVAYDEGQQELVDIAMHVQRRIWHEINLSRKATAAGVAGSSQVLLASAEQIEPGHRVAIEYTLADRLGFNPWAATMVPREAPVSRMKFTVAREAASAGLALELITPAGGPPPPGFESAGTLGWTVVNVPARQRIRTPALAFQPHETELFPYFLASVTATQAETLTGYAAHYRAAWGERVAGIDLVPVRAQAGTLVSGAASWSERVTAIARFVQRDIQYDDSNQRSIESWLPLSTAETLRSRKADCKGKTMILQALLKAVDVEAVPVLLRSETSYFSWRGKPGAAFLNHIVLAVRPPEGAPEIAATLVEGPLAGWVLLDPTVETAAFGRPVPGLEGVPALAVAPEAGVMLLHTREPSVVRIRADVDWRLDSLGGAEVRVHLFDNGGSPLLARVRSVGAGERERAVSELIATRLPGVSVSHCEVRDPWQSPTGNYEVELGLRVANTTHVLSSSLLAEGPLALAAHLAGIPNGFAAAARPRPEDSVMLAPPWDSKRNATGAALVIDVAASLELPEGAAWLPPAARLVRRPWLTFERKWEARDPGRWAGSVHIELARGAWSDAERSERLTLTDEVFASLYAPHVLSRPAVP